MYSNNSNPWAVREVKKPVDNKDSHQLSKIITKLSKKIQNEVLVNILKELTNLKLSTVTIEKLINFKNEISKEQKDILKEINRLIGRSKKFDEKFVEEMKEHIKNLNLAKEPIKSAFLEEPVIIYEPKNVEELENKAVFKNDNEDQKLTKSIPTVNTDPTPSPTLNKSNTSQMTFDPNKINNAKSETKEKNIKDTKEIDFDSKFHRRYTRGPHFDGFKRWNKKKK